MKWEKLGKIFDPRDFVLANNCELYAQSPQALVFDDYIRIYFASRERDETSGKYLSHISYVDMTSDFRRVLNVSDKTVIPLGELGCFDEHGIFPFNVLKHGDEIYGYSCGWSRRSSVSVETGVGFAVSRDGGESFQKYGNGPILTASQHEPFLVGDAFVKVINGVFHMWYMFGRGWRHYDAEVEPDRTYKIGHAVSIDGVNWQKEEGKQIIEDVLGPEESQALPSVIEIDGRFHMFFCFRESFDFRQSRGRGYRLGHAWSDDLSNWTRADDFFTFETGSDDWDSDMVCYPHVFQCDGKVLLLYNGNQFGRYGFGAAQLVNS